MTDGRLPTPGCMDSETLAAFIDGRLEPRERAAVEAHLAECEGCYEVWMDVVAVQQKAVAATPGANRFWRPALWTAAAAAVLITAYWFRPISDEARTQQAVDTLVSAVGASRPALGRFSVGFAWADVVTPTRSSETRPVPLAVQEAALGVRMLAAKIESAAVTRAFGIAEIAEGRIDSGIKALEASVAAEPSNADFHADLSAALLERWYRHRVAEDAARALNEAQLAVTASAGHLAALFNLALAAEAAGDQRGAVQAWKTYLARDDHSPWAAEARRRLAELERAVQPPVSASRLLERRLLVWAAAAADGRAGHVDLPLDPGNATPVADTYSLTLAETAVASTRTGKPNPRILASALLTLKRSRERFDQSDHLGAAEEARAASRLFRSLGMNTLEADMQVAWSLFFAPQREAGLAMSKRIAASPHVASMPRVLGRHEYMTGLYAIGVGQRTQGVQHYLAAIQHFERAGDVEQVAATHALISEALRNQGDVAQSWRHLSAALSALPALSTARRQIHVLALAMQGASQAGYDGAALWFSEGLASVVRETDDPGAHVTLHLLRAPLLARLGNIAAARSSFAEGRAASGRFADPETQRRYLGEFGWLEGRALHQLDPAAAVKALTGAIDAFGTQRLQARLAEVYLYRGRAYLASGDRTRAEGDWLSGINLLRGQAAEITDRRLRAAWADSLWGLFSEMIESHADRPMVALAWLEASRAALNAGIGDNAITEVAPVTNPGSRLGSDVVVVLTSLPDDLLKWTFDATGDHFSTESVGTAELSGLCEAFVTALSEGRAPAADLTARLSALLLPARLPGDPGASVIFVADGPLRLFPFGTLRVSGTEQALIEVAVPRVTSSFLTATQGRAAASGVARPLLIGVSDPGRGSGLQFLPNAAAEVDAVKELYASPSVLVNADATQTEVLKHMPSATLIHFATHALVDQKLDQAALVLFSKDTLRTISTDTIAAQRLQPGTLVILSACDTAVSAVTASNSSVSLADAFLRAGASAVIGTLWKIPDADVRTLMTLVHLRLLAGRPSHLALVEAQRSLLKHTATVSTWASLAHISG